MILAGLQFEGLNLIIKGASGDEAELSRAFHPEREGDHLLSDF